MRIPKEFTIKGKKWRVKHQRELRAKSQSEGETHYSDRLILLEHFLNPIQKQKVFWHEFFHAALYEIHVTDHEGGVSGITEEVICDGLADIMYHTFKCEWKRKDAKQ